MRVPWPDVSASFSNRTAIIERRSNGVFGRRQSPIHRGRLHFGRLNLSEKDGPKGSGCFALGLKVCDLLQANRHRLCANLIRSRKFLDPPVIVEIKYPNFFDVFS